MTPAVGWSEADYYRASRAARRAWQATNAQLEISGLDEGVARAGSRPVPAAAPSSSPRSSSPEAGSLSRQSKAPVAQDFPKACDRSQEGD